MSIWVFLSIALCLSPANSRAQESDSKPNGEFVEKRASKSATNDYYDQLTKRRQKQDEEQLNKESLIQSARHIYANFSTRFRVPGFISATPLPQMARIVGPVLPESNFRMGDTLFVRWSGAPMPKPGDRFSTFTPAIVTQNLLAPTEFSVFLSQYAILPKDTRLAGYFYEVTGRLKILRTRGGLVEAMVEQQKGQITVGDELMKETPKIQNLTPINSGIQLSAAIVCGSPYDRLSTTEKSFIYINRGSRDGIRVGRVFESIESVALDQSVGGAAPVLSNGEAIVIHTTDSYSTAMITRQFDVIRMGSLLRTKQETNPITPISPFDGYKKENTEKKKENQIPIVPNLESLPSETDASLPEPRQKAPEPQLSDLDSLEKSLQTNELSPSEKTRLNKLSNQEKIKSANLEELEEDNGVPGTPSLENSFQDGKKGVKKDRKPKKKAKNDEEELNQLMMEN